MKEMNMEMEKFTIYKKDVQRWENGMLKSSKTMATYLSGNKKGQKINLKSMTNVSIDDLIGKTFFATVVKCFNDNYIVDCFVK